MSILRGLIVEKREQCAVEAAAVEKLIGLVTAELDWAGVQYRSGINLIIAYNHKTGCALHISVRNSGFVYGRGCLPPESDPVSFSELLEILAEWLA